jgi:hypothetical protein
VVLALVVTFQREILGLDPPKAADRIIRTARSLRSRGRRLLGAWVAFF